MRVYATQSIVIHSPVTYYGEPEAHYEDSIKRGAKIDWELYEAPYGCLEFGIQDLDGHDIAFGQDLDA